MNLPDYHFLSAPLWLITVLHVFTLTLHFVAMNLMFGSLAIIAFGRLTRRWEQPVVRRCVSLLPSLMATTVTLGIAPLLFLQLAYPRPVYSAAIVSGWFWMAVIPAVIIAYYLLYGAALSESAPPSRKRLYLVIALLCVTYVSFAYSSIFSLAERPAQIASAYAARQDGVVLNTRFADYLFRWLHMLTGAITVSGFFIGVLGRNDDPAFRLGKRVYVSGMIAAGVFGFLYLAELSDIMLPLMRGSGAWILLASIVLSLGSLHFFFVRKFWASGAMLFVSLLGMVALRHIVRLMRLGPEHHPAQFPIAPQWSVFALFVLCLVAALGVVAYMLQISLTPDKGER